MKTPRAYNNLKEFYPFYLGEHDKKGTRISHFVGTTFFLAFLTITLVTLNPWYLIPTATTPYFFAWIGHFFIEHNQPATFKYPLWSLVSDFKMYFGMLTGKQHRGN